jgi:hypothetical protein
MPLDASAEERSQLSQLADLCRSTPREGLAQIQNLPDRLREQQSIRLLEALAHYSIGFANVGSHVDLDLLRRLEAPALRRLVDQDELVHLEQGLAIFAEIERANPGTIHSLRNDSSAYGVGLLDSLAFAVERLCPGKSYAILGYTILLWYGSDRIHFAPSILETLPDDLFDALLSVPIFNTPPVLSVVAMKWETTDTGARLVELEAYASVEPNEGERAIGTLGLFTDGRMAFLASS